MVANVVIPDTSCITNTCVPGYRYIGTNRQEAIQSLGLLQSSRRPVGHQNWDTLVGTG